MSTEAPRTAISIGNAKEAAICFDHVVSVVFALDLLTREDESDITRAEYESELETDLEFLKALEPEAIRDSKQFQERTLAAQENWLDFLIETAGDSDLRDMSQESALKRYSAALNDVVARQHVPLRAAGLEAAPVILPAMPHPSDILVTDDGPARDIALTISGIQVVDVSRASWEQVMEFREDPENLRRLRRLRLFAGEDYSHQSMSYIEDDLARKVFEYRQAIRDAGLPTNPGAFTVSLTSKAIASGRWGTLLSTVFDTSAFGAMAAVKGATIEIGALKLVVSRKRFALRGTLIDNPVSYATAVERRTGAR